MKKVEAEASVRKVEAEVKKVEAEASVRKVEAELEMEYLKTASGRLDSSLEDLARKRLHIMADKARLATPVIQEFSSQISSSPHFLVSPERLENEQLWSSAIVERNVKRGVVPIDNLLDAEIPLKTAVRWLLLHQNTRSTSLQSVKDMRKKRKNDPKKIKDEELPYHPLLLTIYNGACVGQPSIEFLAEEKVDGAREDVRCIINNFRMDPTEVKSDYDCTRDNNISQTDAIDANAEPFGKLLKCVLARCSGENVTRLCTFASRIHCIWLLRIHLDASAKPVEINVAPPFPHKGMFFTSVS